MSSDSRLKLYLESKYSHLEMIPYDYLEDELLCTATDAIAYTLGKKKRGMVEVSSVEKSS